MDTRQVAKISKALADPTRLRIYETIASRQETYCGEIIAKHRLTPGTISHHLRVLAEAGLIECRREGQYVYNRALPQAMRHYTRTLARLARPARSAAPAPRQDPRGEASSSLGGRVSRRGRAGERRGGRKTQGQPSPPDALK